MDATLALGILIYWTRSRVSCRSIQLNFDVALNNGHVWLGFCQKNLLKVLMSEPAAQVCMVQDRAKVEIFVTAIKSKYCILGREIVAFSIDGLNLNIEKP